MAPDDVEHSRMQVLELRVLRLVELSLHNSGSPLLPRFPSPSVLFSVGGYCRVPGFHSLAPGNFAQRCSRETQGGAR
jgi:hypothetical protein